MAQPQEAVNVPRPRKSVTFGLIVLAIFMPWLALYLDGASWPTIGCNFAAWALLFIPGMVGVTVHAIICLCRTDEHRKFSKPARRRLRYDNNYSAVPVPVESKIEESELEPAPVEALPTEPAVQPTAASSSTSVSSSDVEKENPPATEPLPRSATEPLPRTATVKKDDPFKDPNV
ncbi:hypothetical protein C7974DRAFT_416629 [Boeremia exigua]|uniref:uncharacterized protein n=1 Tax=Boeremia exigua TaxID=749465 RepID=UPI001E8E8C57|nr:uncharacterized protein C7974DRAFT_416629 [Boeremia exigua]KAH6616500.1 hypothetical protein C7974DRAFT_416629 [Boeremia exigua]